MNQDLDHSPNAAFQNSQPQDRASNFITLDPSQAQPALNTNSGADVAAEEIVIQLLEERLVVDRSKRKIGEVIVRKEVEIRMVEVPVRYERLIVEQVSPERQQLAVVDLSQGEVTGVELDPQNLDASQPITDAVGIHVDFTSLEHASQVLHELAQLDGSGDASPRIEIVLKDQGSQQSYWNWLKQQSS